MNLQDSARESWEKLSDRERRMLSIMAMLAALILVFVSVWASSSAVADVEEERDQIRKVLSEIARSGDVLEKRGAERAALEARLRNTPPPLAAFLETKAKEEGLEVRQVVEQPEKEISGYRRQNVRLHFTGVSLRPVMRFLSSVESEPMPLAVERLVIEHYQQGDVYKVEVGVVGFEKKSGPKASGGAKDKADEENKEGEQ